MAARYEPVPAFRALADPARLRIARLVAGTGEISGQELIGLAALPSPVVYYHLRSLVEAGLLVVRKERREHYYRSSDAAVRLLLASVTSAVEGVETEVA